MKVRCNDVMKVRLISRTNCHQSGNSAGTNVATAEPDPSPESSSSVPVLSAESTSVESAAELVPEIVQSDVSIRR